MALSKLQHELIEKYLGNRLTSEEKISFEGNLTFQEFRDELLLQAKLIDALSDALDKDLKFYLNEYDNLASDEAKTRFLSEPFVKYAAAVLLLVASILIFYFNSDSSKRDYISLIETYNFTFPAEIVERGMQNEISDEYKNALALYANGQYEASILAFSNLSDLSGKAHLYLANAYIELSEFEKAIEILENKFIEVKGLKIKLFASSIQQNRDWYLAIAKLGIGNENDAKQEFKKIANSKDHIFREKAKAILTEF